MSHFVGNSASVRIELVNACKLSVSVSVSVYYVAVRTIVLSRHGSNLERPVIIHDIIHGLIYVPSTPYCGFFGVSPDGNCAYVHWGSFTSNSKSVRRAIWFTWFSEPHDSVYGTWQSQAVTHPLMNWARRRLTSVIEQISMSERRIPFTFSVLLKFKMSATDKLHFFVGART